MILWGPPGSGKTTLAKIIASSGHCHFEAISAVVNNTADIKKIFTQAAERKSQSESTILLVDEIHRFNRIQQDIFLPYIEDGTITLIGATTENPSFALSGALLSRCKVLVVKRLDKEALRKILERAETVTEQALPLTEEARELLLELADGDGRYMLNMCEELFGLKPAHPLSSGEMVTLLQKRAPIYDKSHDEHYNIISALHKSLRGSDANASLYWLCRMLNAGEDPFYILRRLARCAVEDIGLADPKAIEQVMAAQRTYEFLGSPEGELALAQATVYLATAPKSNAVYVAYGQAMKAAKATGSISPPKHILNAPTSLMKQEAYGKGYIYDHDTKECFSGQNYFPEGMDRQGYYYPVERGFEREIKARMAYWQKLRERVGG
jgi:putative ATPase